MVVRLGEPALQFSALPHRAAASRLQTPLRAGSPLRALKRNPERFYQDCVFI